MPNGPSRCCWALGRSIMLVSNRFCLSLCSLQPVRSATTAPWPATAPAPSARCTATPSGKDPPPAPATKDTSAPRRTRRPCRAPVSPPQAAPGCDSRSVATGFSYFPKRPAVFRISNRIWRWNSVHKQIDCFGLNTVMILFLPRCHARPPPPDLPPRPRRQNAPGCKL